uniref:Retrotransposon protein, putative, Ty1-copia subclass n=1 Tax=Tanacetum cinerariifolium TaxID=118510 RepID=A0A699HEC2_TANCI|nr:retrotransposon protein, putative, Ty1-copia subclass [Tanacetum cinerariifolium]
MSSSKVKSQHNCIYSLDGHAMTGELHASIEEKDSFAHVWHKRLGHISEAGLQFWCRKAHYSGSDRLCLFRLIGSVLGGIIGRFKHEAFGKFKEWKQLVENQTGRTVKKLKTDNGLEFFNWEFEQLCIKSRIARHLTSGLPKTFLAEATCTAEYLINRSPSRAIEKKTHMEMWSGHPSDYGMLRIFGCGVYPYDKQCDKSVEELQVKVELHMLSNHMPKEDQTYQEDGDDEDAGDQATDQSPDLTDYQLEEDTHEPLTYQEAVSCEDISKWKATMKEEMDSLKKNKTWELVDHLVVRHTSNRVILALTACKDYELEQLDVKTAFLHGNLKEVIYMRQPPGYEQDDMLIACKSKAEIGSTKSLLKKEFDMKELGEAKKILGMEIAIDRSRKILRVSQFGDCDVERMSKVPYANAVRILIYLMVCTRPDMAYAVYGTNRGNHVDVTVFVDLDYAKDLDKGREVLKAKTVKVLKVGTEYNVADALTKVVHELKLQHYLELLNVGVG